MIFHLTPSSSNPRKSHRKSHRKNLGSLPLEPQSASLQVNFTGTQVLFTKMMSFKKWFPRLTFEFIYFVYEDSHNSRTGELVEALTLQTLSGVRLGPGSYQILPEGDDLVHKLESPLRNANVRDIRRQPELFAG
ncbi:hypothetical protein N7456_009979 [Penicillium angulare]|uniref:Uncharacterized protein n=1 Tax=Penicillium angulare TaxID=116970 RepID=A0A9W9F5P9_9EURO|nr:hypothetical protein N7456_009979 [Penicillium angulare]